MVASDLTTIRIRGKRNAKPEEKWRPRAKRPRTTEQTDDSVGRLSLPGLTPDERPKKRKQRKIKFAPLEELPTEILQTIFVLSGNVDLPLVTPRLAQQLTSRHLYLSLSDRVLGSVLGQNDPKPSQSALLRATRLLNARFMTWLVFKDWLLNYAGLKQSANDDDPDFAVLWAGLEPAEGLLPPAKLLSGPWSPDRIRFLQCLLTPDMQNSTLSNLYCVDLAQRGLGGAVDEKSVEAVRLLLGLGCVTTQDLIRKAVVEAGCVQEIVEMLLQRAQNDGQYDSLQERWTQQSSIDNLDPVLWSWIEKAEQSGNQSGAWLKMLLRSANNQRT